MKNFLADSSTGTSELVMCMGTRIIIVTVLVAVIAFIMKSNYNSHVKKEKD